MFLPLFVIYFIFFVFFFFFNDTATTEIYTLSLHDALPISHSARASLAACKHGSSHWWAGGVGAAMPADAPRTATKSARNDQSAFIRPSWGRCVISSSCIAASPSRHPRPSEVSRTVMQRFSQISSDLPLSHFGKRAWAIAERTPPIHHPQRGRMRSSVRRFCARPAAVSLEATGSH